MAQADTDDNGSQVKLTSAEKKGAVRAARKNRKTRSSSALVRCPGGELDGALAELWRVRCSHESIRLNSA